MDAYWQLLEPHFIWLGIDPRKTRETTAIGELGPRSRILLSEKDPKRFLSFFYAALIQNCDIWLADPNWGEDRWRQACSICRPHISIGRPILASEDSIDPSILQLRHKLGQEPGIYIPTGGSSGHLKFACHTWQTLSKSAYAFLKHFQEKQHHSCCVLPLHHVSGLMQSIRVLLSGGELNILTWHEFEQGEFLPDSDSWFISLVPSQLDKLIKQGKAELLSPFNTILLGGASASKELLKKAYELKLPVSTCYGMTETAAMVTALKPDEFLAQEQSNGLCLPHAKIFIKKDDESDPVTNENGAICIQSESLFIGYAPGGSFNQIELKTNDIGMITTDGYLIFDHRADRMINRSGEKIDPVEVEKVFKSFEFPKIVVFGQEDEKRGQIVAAAIEAEDLKDIEEYKEELQKLLSPNQIPVVWYAFQEIPIAENGKVSPVLLQEKGEKLNLNW